MYLLTSNCAPCLILHSSAFFNILLNFSALLAALDSFTTYAMSFMKLSFSVPEFSVDIFNKSLLYKIYNMSDSEDSCGIPAGVEMTFE